MKILFSEIAQLYEFLTLTFQLPDVGVRYITDCLIRGGHKYIAEVLSDIYDPSIPKKMVAPLNDKFVIFLRSIILMQAFHLFYILDIDCSILNDLWKLCG